MLLSVFYFKILYSPSDDLDQKLLAPFMCENRFQYCFILCGLDSSKEESDIKRQLLKSNCLLRYHLAVDYFGTICVSPANRREKCKKCVSIAGR